ncbi:MAG: hypothetical protein H6900_16860 [Rhodobacter sp.]|uniref:hypothetical protein n=1 Tax=Pararhodobacter sp. TaxID=2127056 RepID=UPI001D773863|nr:hypothetical protein [Pararhodobacter sp.]MCB1344530.1 hypothetical protein [Paracoccaceae bacterium]MCC0074949.1 hypothetical protein [Rhodobacter sp.]HPD93692.1 hypothetical protein [Pararhodobacter sp.]
MKTPQSLRLKRPRRVQILSAGVFLLAGVVYFGTLHAMDGRAEAYFRQLRQSDPALYLTQVREAQGFDTFLTEYRILNNYEDFHQAPPNFLVGRWTLRPEPIRLSPGTAPSECSDPVTLDYGLFLQLETGGVALPVSYRIEGKTVEMRIAPDSVVPIELVSYGAQLDHIAFTAPGRDAVSYGYLCGR